jgi:hypothetical protein
MPVTPTTQAADWPFDFAMSIVFPFRRPEMAAPEESPETEIIEESYEYSIEAEAFASEG